MWLQLKLLGVLHSGPFSLTAASQRGLKWPGQMEVVLAGGGKGTGRKYRGQRDRPTYFHPIK